MSLEIIAGYIQLLIKLNYKRGGGACVIQQLCNLEERGQLWLVVHDHLLVKASAMQRP